MPSWILWTFQPLKDTYFLLLIATFFFVTDAWLTRLMRAEWSWPAACGLLAAQVAVIYALAGIRWYSAVLVVGTAPLGLLAVIGVAGRRSIRRVVLATATLVILAEAISPGAGPYLPPWIRGLIHPVAGEMLSRVADAPDKISLTLELAHDASVQAKGSTTIRIGGDEGAGLGLEREQADGAATTSGIGLVKRVGGTLAVFTLPRWLATRVADVTVGGGRGLWAFVDLDTVCFDVALIAVAVTILRLRRRGAVTYPTFWHVLSATLLVAILLVFQIANFGTLFRLRSMVMLGIALLPLTVGWPGKDPATHAPGS
jgi:hypothetical protein